MLKKLCSILLALFLVVCTSPIVFAEEIVDNTTSSEIETMVEKEPENDAAAAPQEQPQIIDEEKVEIPTQEENKEVNTVTQEKPIEKAAPQKIIIKSTRNAEEPMAVVKIYVNNVFKNTVNLPILYGSIDIWQYNNAYGELPTNGGSATINGVPGIFLFYGGDNCTIFKQGYGMVEDNDKVVVNLYYQTEEEEETVEYGTIELKFKPQDAGHEITFYGEKGAESEEITLSVDDNGILKGDNFNLSYTWTFQAGNAKYVLNKDDFIDSYWSTDASLEEYVEPVIDQPDGLDHILTIVIEFSRESGGNLIDLSSDTKFDSLEKQVTKKGGDTITWNELIGNFNQIEVLNSNIVYNGQEFRSSSLGMTGPNCTMGTLINHGETIMPNGDTKIALQFIYVEPKINPVPEPQPKSETDPTLSTKPTSTTNNEESQEFTVSTITTLFAPIAATANPTDIEDIRIPLAKTEETWALVNLIAMVVTVTISLILTILGWYNRWRRRNIELDEDENEKYQFWLRNKILFRIITSTLAIVSIITFILTENIFLRLVFVDRFTPLMIAFAILAIGAAFFSKYVIKEYYPQTQEDIDNDDDEDEE